ncbi:MAG: glycerophosphodiester phosphodiesterase family protein [Patescibacteria group bacterium]
MNILPLSFIFLGAGLFSVVYYKLTPDKEMLKARLPNKVGAAGIILWLIICVAFYFIFKNSRGFERTVSIFTLLFALLVFETFFLLLIRWFKSNLLAVLIALLASGVLFAFHNYYPTFTLRNTLIILGTLGATTLLIKLNYLKTWIVFGLAFLWTGYDIYTTRYFLPNVLVPVTEPPKTFFFPSVITGSVSLGSGDFIFLVLFTLIILKKFGKLAALILVAAQTAGLLFTGLFLESDSIIPFLAVMTPIFLIIYLILFINLKPKEKNMLKIGHRGACGYEPENTLASFEKALALKVDMVEFDVYVCKTGEIVIIHDDTLERTTNGQGLVWEKTFGELRALDAGQGEKIPTLPEILDLIDKKVAVNIELKGPGTAKPVADVIREYLTKGWKNDHFIVSSFNLGELDSFYQLFPDIKIAALIENEPKDLKNFIKDKGYSAINPGLKFVTREFVNQVHKLGLKVYVWTVNEKEDLERMKKWGVDGVFSNYPDRV